MDSKHIKKLEADLWESADLLRSGSKLTSNQYCMPVLGLLFLRYAYSRFKKAEAEILKDRPVRRGRQMPVEPSDFTAKSALFLPREAQYAYLADLPQNITEAGLLNKAGETMNSLGEAVNNAMSLVEEQSVQLRDVLPQKYSQLIADYHQGLKEAAEETERSEDIRPLLADDFTQTAAKVQEYLEAQRNKAKEELAAAQRKEKKALQAKWDEELTAIEEIVTIAKEANELMETISHDLVDIGL